MPPCADFAQPSIWQRLPPPCAMHSGVPPCAAVEQFSCWHRRPPPCAMQCSVPPAADALEQPSCVHRRPPPCALQYSVPPATGQPNTVTPQPRPNPNPTPWRLAGERPELGFHDSTRDSTRALTCACGRSFGAVVELTALPPPVRLAVVRRARRELVAAILFAPLTASVNFTHRRASGDLCLRTPVVLASRHVCCSLREGSQRWWASVRRFDGSLGKRAPPFWTAHHSPGHVNPTRHHGEGGRSSTKA